MPQSLTPTWVQDLGPDYEVIHQTWKDRIANLTLTAYNSKYSNRSFSDKKTIEDGFLESGIRMNQRISQKAQWTLVELEERNADLMELALNIWQRPDTNFQPSVKPLERCSLEDDVTLTHCTLVSFSYQGVKHKVSSWAEMLEEMVGLLHQKKPFILRNLAVAKDGVCASVVSTDSETFANKICVEDGLYFSMHSSTQMKIGLLRRLFSAFQEKAEDLVFDVALNEDMEEQEHRHELQRSYWTFALPGIREKHEGKSFANVKPSKYGYINGAIGISQCHILCGLNQSEVRVELYLGKSKEENQAMFQRLLKDKQQIEDSLGTALVWRGTEQHKSASISLSLEGVYLKNRKDWDKMADFHAVWSRKFYDVFVPLCLSCM